MSHPENDPTLPEFDTVHSPSFEEVLERIKNGTLSELTSGTHEGVQMVLVGNRPRAEGEVWVDPDGGIVRSFRGKFEDGFEGWQPGEVVNARFVLTRGRGDGRPGLMVSDAYMNTTGSEDSQGLDIRHADTFMLPELSEEEDLALRNLGMALIDADVEVASTGVPQESNMFAYEARIHRINAIQAPWDGETAPQIGAQVLLQGEVVRYAAGEIDRKNASFPVAEVRLSNGRTVPVEMTNGYIDYHDGNLDFLYPAGLQAGDIVQINTTFGNASKVNEHRYRLPTLHVASCRSAYLLQPGAERFATYEAHRADVAARLAELGTLDGQSFRGAYASLLHTYVVADDNQQKFFSMLLTDQEKTSLKELVDQKFPNGAGGNPSPDRPLTDFEHIREMATVNRGYAVDVYGMDRQEFYAFCLDVANGRVEADYSLKTSVYYPFCILSDGDERFTPREQFEVYRQTVEHWLPYLRGKDVVSRGGIIADPERQVTFDEQRLAERAIDFMVSVAAVLPEARDYMYDATVQALRELADEDPERLHRDAGRISYTFCRGLKDMIDATAAWDRNRGSLGVKDAAGLSYFVDKLAELGNIAGELETIGSHRAPDVLDLMARITKLNSLPPYTG